MKNKTLFQSIRCAWAGMKRAFETEKNLKTYVWIALCTLVINGLAGVWAYGYIPYFICVCGVFSAECLNTAAEKICNYLTEDYEDKIKEIKDIAAGAVLIWGLAFWVTEIILIGAKIIG